MPFECFTLWTTLNASADIANGVPVAGRQTASVCLLVHPAHRQGREIAPAAFFALVSRPLFAMQLGCERIFQVVDHKLRFPVQGGVPFFGHWNVPMKALSSLFHRGGVPLHFTKIAVVGCSRPQANRSWIRCCGNIQPELTIFL